MRSMQKTFSFIMIALVLLSVLGCGSVKNAKQQAQKEESSGTYSIVDATGTKLVFYKKPTRIISFSCSVDEILVDLVPLEHIAALTTLADNPEISAVAEKARGVKNRVRSNASESIVALHPDLIIAADWMDLTSIQVLRDMGIPVYVYATPVTMEEIQQSIRNIAFVTGEKAQGEKLISNMQAVLDNVHEHVKIIPPEKRLTMIAFSQMGTFGAKGSTLDDACKHANIINGVALTGVGQNENLNKEQIIMVDPDVFLLPTWDEFNRGELPAFIEDIKDDPAYKGVKAVRNNRFIHVDDKYLYSISHYSAYAVDGLARGVYPEYYK